MRNPGGSSIRRDFVYDKGRGRIGRAPCFMGRIDDYSSAKYLMVRTIWLV